MIELQDSAAPLRETKSQRKELRLMPSVMDTIERASQSVGMDASTFITTAAFSAAQKVEASQQITALNSKAFDAFATAVDSPAKTNKALSDLFAARDDFLLND